MGRRPKSEPPRGLPRVEIEPSDIGRLLDNGWLAKTVTLDGETVAVRLDLALVFTDAILGIRIARAFRTVAEQLSKQEAS